MMLAVSALVLTAHASAATHSRQTDPIPQDQRIDANRASVAALEKVPGLTHVWAERIVRFRPYHSKKDLLDRGVLPDRVYDRARDYLIVHRLKP